MNFKGIIRKLTATAAVVMAVVATPVQAYVPMANGTVHAIVGGDSKVVVVADTYANAFQFGSGIHSMAEKTGLIVATPCRS